MYRIKRRSFLLERRLGIIGSVLINEASGILSLRAFHCGLQPLISTTMAGLTNILRLKQVL